MPIDIICVIVLVAGIIKGYRSGLIQSIFSFVGFILGTILALRFSYIGAIYLNRWFNIDSAYMPILSFLVIFLAILFGLIFFGRLLEGVLKISKINLVNRIGGAAMWALTGLFLLSTVLWYLAKSDFIKEDVTEQSISWQYVQPISPAVMKAAGTVIPILKDQYENIEKQIEQKYPRE